MCPWPYTVNTALSEAEKEEVAALADAGVTGKWMPFTDPEWVRGVWADIVAATEAVRLGFKAKFATDHKPGKGVLICVYTTDWRDQRDVARVLGELRAMGISQRLSYKEDAATLALHYGQGASLYVSQARLGRLQQAPRGLHPADQHPIFGGPRSTRSAPPRRSSPAPTPTAPSPAELGVDTSEQDPALSTSSGQSQLE